MLVLTVANRIIILNQPVFQINFSSLLCTVIWSMCYQYKVERKAKAGQKPKIFHDEPL